MRDRRAAISIVLLMLLAMASLAGADEPRFGSAANIVTIDIDRVIRASAEYQAKLEGIRRDGKRAVDQQRADRDEIVQLLHRPNLFTPGSAEYRAAEARIVQHIYGCRFFDEEMRRSAFKRQAKVAAERLYGELRAKVLDEIAAYAKEQGIDLVIDNSPSAMRDEALAVDRLPSSPVVFSSVQDISEEIAKRLSP